MGKIAKINLRGISRAPSDRMTSDGGCAESLNVYLDSTETAPVLIPDDETDIVGSNGKTYRAKRIFIHKTANYTNYVLHLEQGNQIGVFIDGEFKAFATLDSEETLSDITSIGNTIILATSTRMMYALFANGEYRYLGDRIPEPYIQFLCQEYTLEREDSFYLVPLGSESDNEIDRLNTSAWAGAISDISLGRESLAATRLLEIQTEIWSRISRMIKEAKRNKTSLCPLFVRYAVRLYDGSYIYQSVPILLGAGEERFVRVSAAQGNDYTTNRIFINCGKPFNVTAYLYGSFDSNWGDIIDSVDFFISTDICYPYFNANISSLLFDESIAKPDESAKTMYAIDFFNGEIEDKDAVEAELLRKSQFFKVATFKFEDFDNLKSGVKLFESDFPWSQDDLLERDRLPDYEQSGTLIIPSRLSSYNNRILAVGSKRILPSGYSGMQSVWKQDSENPKRYCVSYSMKHDESLKILAINQNGEYVLSSFQPYGLFFHPDRRCSKLRIFDVASKQEYSCDMKPHPLLNCSYAYWGLDQKVQDLSNPTSTTQTQFTSGENRYEEDSNRIYLSEIGNPFYFPISGNTLLSAPVTDIAIANTALSEGQFGQFPVYIFTRDGIWVLETGADGSFVSSKPLSRETCLPGAAIASLDQAVVFISAKGVMLLSGSQISDISPYMNGRHYILESTPQSIIGSMPLYQDLLPAITDLDPFMRFMADAKIAYDYSGKRLIFISPSNTGYQYVYKLDTQTWHKISLGLNLSDTINSYPDCLVMASTGSITKIYNLSTKLDIASEDQQTPKAVIITRPFDLGEPDVYKSIKNIRIRGQYTKGNVRFILLGSEDGLNFYTLNTLRGKSWKVFRMIILAHLEPTERLSWIDVEYESRLTNRLR